MLQGYKASAFPLPDSPTLRSNSLPCTLQSLTTDSTGKYWISPRHTEHWGSIEAWRWFTHTWLERERCPNVSTAARYAHACGGWFEDIDGLAGGSLDHNARSFREMCASALTHVSREITKVCVCLKRRVWRAESFFRDENTWVTVCQRRVDLWEDYTAVASSFLSSSSVLNSCSTHMLFPSPCRSFHLMLLCSPVPPLTPWCMNTTRSAQSCSRKTLSTSWTTNNCQQHHWKSYFIFLPSALRRGRWEFIVQLQKWSDYKKHPSPISTALFQSVQETISVTSTLI